MTVTGIDVSRRSLRFGSLQLGHVVSGAPQRTKVFEAGSGGDKAHATTRQVYQGM